jgi:hypothetical protein
LPQPYQVLIRAIEHRHVDHRSVGFPFSSLVEKCNYTAFS